MLYGHVSLTMYNMYIIDLMIDRYYLSGAPMGALQMRYTARIINYCRDQRNQAGAL